MLTRDSVIFDFYTAKAVHEQVAERIANVAWHSARRKPNTEEGEAFRGGLDEECSMAKLNVDGTEIQVLQIEEDDYISLTDCI